MKAGKEVFIGFAPLRSLRSKDLVEREFIDFISEGLSGYGIAVVASRSGKKKSVPLGQYPSVAVYGVRYCTSTKPHRPKLWTSLRNRVPASVKHGGPYSSLTPGPWWVVTGVNLTGVTHRADESGREATAAGLWPTTNRQISRGKKRR
jgi:hypothetical protein